ncbi:MAG: hypothetical protein Q7U28_16475 [Aquabacterium sp.]|nr:hypothetical protein [Aquabacterium sp.]
MQFTTLSIRAITVAAATLAVAASANAALTLPTNFLVADSVQAFSELSQDSFAADGVTVTPLGNATAVAGAVSAYRLPITTITLNGLKISKGDAKGSALQFTRTYRSKDYALTLANFTINYDTKQVLADATASGGVTSKQQAIYNFHTAMPLAIKYKFPLRITAHEVLDELMLTPETVNSFVTGLSLNKAGRSVISSISFGTLTQDIAVKFRAKAVSNKLYVPAP